MNSTISKREFFAMCASLAAGAAIAQAPVVAQEGGGKNAGKAAPPPIPNKKATTTKLFKSPYLAPNALAVAPEGLWLGEQKSRGQIPAGMSAPPPPAPGFQTADEAAWLVDWNGKLLRTVMTHSRNTSGMAYGDGCVLMGANAAPYGIFQVDMDSKQVSQRQIPLSPGGNGGGCHGMQWHNDKLWIAALNLGGMVRVDPRTWVPEILILVRSDAKPRLHDITVDDAGDLYVVTGNNSTGPADSKAGLSKYDGKTGKLVMTADFEPGSCDPHGLGWHDGKLVSCDAGLHPGWADYASPTSGWVFQINIV